MRLTHETIYQALCRADRAVTVDTDGQVHRPVRHHPIADLDHQGVDEHHGIDAIEWPGLPLCSSSSTASVTREIRSGETSTSYISRRCARMSRTDMPRAYNAMMRSLN